MANLTQTAANVGLTANSASTTATVVQAGEAITQGMPVYLLSSKYYKADASALGSAAATHLAVTPAATDEYFVAVPTGGTVDLGATLTVGTTYVVSATAGAIAPEADLLTGEFVTSLGVASAAGELVLDINATGVAKP